MNPEDKRERDERRLTALKAGTVGLTIAGLGVFAGLAAAGTDDAPTTTPGSQVAPASGQSAVDAARAAEDDSFFDDQAQGGAVGDYQGYADQGSAPSGDSYGGGDHDGWEHHDGDHHDRHGHHGPPPGSYGGDYGGGAGGGAPDAMPDQAGASGGYAPSQGSSGGTQ